MDQWNDPDDLANKEEIAARKAQETEKFKVADRNEDGKLDVSEVPSLFYPETDEGVLAITTRTTMNQKDLDKDGKLSIKEFWEGSSVPGEELDITEDERKDFAILDMDHDGLLDLSELRHWESGRFH